MYRGVAFLGEGREGGREGGVEWDERISEFEYGRDGETVRPPHPWKCVGMNESEVVLVFYTFDIQCGHFGAM